MSEQFNVDENGFTSDGYRRLNRIAIRPMYVKNLIVTVILLALYAAAIHFSEYTDLLGLVCLTVPVAIIVVYLLVSPIVLYRHYCYRLDEEKIEVRKGVLVINHILVPIERIHQVEVVEGPIMRAFGLCSVNVTTAGGTESVDYLEKEVGDSIAARLNTIVVGILKDRD